MTTSKLKQLRRDFLVLFLAFGFLAPLLLSALFLVFSGLVAYVEASFPEYTGLIYGWSIWLCFCLCVFLGFYRAEKSGLS